MPTYDVNNRAVAAGWNVVAGPPGAPGARPRAILAIAPNSQAVAMGGSANVALAAGAVEGLHTNNLTFCSAFCILWRPAGAASFTRASMMHMSGGPDPNAVNWAAMLANMGPGGQYFGILANSQPTVLTAGFVAAVLANTPIPAPDMWVYDANTNAINFRIDRSGNAGE